LISLLFAGVLAAQKQEAAPRELMEYVRQARKAGLADSQIKLNAVRAGWPPDDLERALASSPPVTKTEPAAAPKTEPEPNPAPKEVVPEVSVIKTAPPAAAPAPVMAVVPTAAAPAAVANPAPSVAVAPTTVTPAPATPAAVATPAPSVAAAPTTVTPALATPASVTKPIEPPRAGTEPGAAGAPPAAAGKTAADTEYEIGAGDVVQVSVWGKQAASVPSAVVRPDGKISMPLLKEVAIAGLTPAQAEKTIAEQLDQFIKGADVTVVVSQINSKKIYLLGAVKKEGTISFTYHMTVMQALSEAGGLTDYAKRKKIYVIRLENGKEYRLPFDYDAVVKGERMESNIPLEPGDTIVVPH
jgi:polysaccharide export outer membrane protein